ncbi:MAG: hypothetical protein GC136_07990 [Alphaproteobacteria bacterium]|nr:hypothetical protein [Alphaproteobacteria bacterium]
MKEKNALGLPKRKKLLFVPVPKTGTHFVNKTLEKHQVDKWIKRLPGYYAHPTRADYADLFRKLRRKIANYKMFTVVRNPWDWHVSAYHYIKGDDGAEKSGIMLESEIFKDRTFRDYILSLKDTSAKITPNVFYIRQQSDWVLDYFGELTNITVIKQEDLEGNLRWFFEEEDIDVPVTASRPNASERDDYRSYYDDETREIVRSLHGRDIKFFGYEF